MHQPQAGKTKLTRLGVTASYRIEDSDGTTRTGNVDFTARQVPADPSQPTDLMSRARRFVARHFNVSQRQVVITGVLSW